VTTLLLAPALPAAVPAALPWSSAVLAHGVGTRADLPLPLAYVVVGGGLAVLVSFLALGVLWRTPRLRGAVGGRPVSGGVEATLESRGLRSALRAVVLGLMVLVVTVAFLGDPGPAGNAAPWALFVTFWVGLVPVSLALGPVWGVLNPLRTAYRLLARLLPAPPFTGLPDRWGHWPAAASLLAFTWYELAAPQRSLPHRVGVALVVYAVVHLAAATLTGERWFAVGEGFEVYSRTLGSLAPIGRRRDGRLVWRDPLDGAAAVPRRPGLVAVVVVLLGSTAFDGLTRTLWWHQGPGADGDSGSAIPASLGLAVTVALVAVAYLTATAAVGRLGGYRHAAGRFAPSLIPIAAGYAIAHYFSLLVFDGQFTWILLSDPFGTGLDLLGLNSAAVDYTLVSDRTIALVQAGAIVAGHVLGVVLAHDRAVSLARDRAAAGHPGRAVLSQLPLMALMVGLTIGALLLLLGG
jgi:hypothetical protein